MIRYLLTAGLLAFILYVARAQNILQGRVTDGGNRPVAGATVKSASGSILAVSDSLGYFKLNRPLPEVVTVSHIAFKDRTLAIDERQAGILTVILQPANQVIQEVSVSTGIQQVPKERATGAFALVDNRTFNEQVSGDVISRLEAVANGLSVDHMAESNEMGIRIRGQSTFSYGSMRDPLIILDNFPFEGDINSINPNDVEHVTLLKDAAAASIWGARAANGVIVITTKRARENQPLKIDFNTNVTIAGKPDLMAYELMSPQEFIEVERFLFGNNHRFGDTASYTRPSFSPVYEVLFRQRAGDLSTHEADRLIQELGRTDIRNEYLDYLYESAIHQQYALNISGGYDNTAWYFSAGYDRNESDLAATNGRLTVNFKNSYRPVKNLQLQTGLLYVQGRSTSGRTGFTNGNMPPYTRFADEDGDPLPAASSVPSTYRLPLVDTLGGGRLLDWKYYPLTDDNHQNGRTALSHILLNVNANYKPISWLGLDAKYQYGRQQTKGTFLWEEDSYFARNLINQFTHFGPSGNVAHNVPKGGILDVSDALLQSHNLRGQLTVNKLWRRHDINVLVGLEASHSNYSDNAYRTYGYNPDILTFSPVDYLGMYPYLIEQYEWFIPQNQYFNDRTNRFISTFLNGAYTYNGKYTLNWSGRRDASNLFGVNVNERWNVLWSTGMGWEVSKESFYRLNFLPYLRLRATYGFSGNTDLSRSAVITIRYAGTSPYTLRPYASISQHANPELRWEKVKMTNLALDFRSKNNRLSGSVDLFMKHATDLLGPDPIGYTTGISGTVTRNVAELRGKGFDLQLSSVNMERGYVAWHSVLNLSYYDDKVIRYYRPGLNPSDYIARNSLSSNIEGQRMYPLYSYRWAGLDETGDPTVYLDGLPSKDYLALRGAETKLSDLVNHGSSIPILFGTLGNTLNYGNFGCSFSLMFKLNYAIRTPAARYYLLFNNRTPTHNEWSQRWKVPGDEQHTNVPSMIYPANSARDDIYRLSDIKMQSGDHIRLQYVNLFYDLGPKSWSRSRINNIRLYFNIADIGVLWKRGNYSHDPLYGFDNVAASTTYSAGVRLSIQ